MSTFTASNEHSSINENPFSVPNNDHKTTPADDTASDTKTALLNDSKHAAASASERDVSDDDTQPAPSEPLLGTSTFKPNRDINKSTEVVWDDYDKDKNPFFE